MKLIVTGLQGSFVAKQARANSLSERWVYRLGHRGALEVGEARRTRPRGSIPGTCGGRTRPFGPRACSALRTLLLTAHEQASSIHRKQLWRHH